MDEVPYAPPKLMTPQSTTVNEQQRRFVAPPGINTVSNPYLSGSAIDNGPVSLSDLPLLNVIDLTKRSANAAKIRSG